MSTDTRAEYIAGLRQLADILDANPDLPVPDHGSTTVTLWFTMAADKDAVAAAVRAIPGPATKNTWGADGQYIDFKMKLGAIGVDVTTMRDTVCTRRVVATREVEVEKPDPDALAAVPTITVTKTVEDVEWDCEPLLAEQVSA